MNQNSSKLEFDEYIVEITNEGIIGIYKYDNNITLRIMENLSMEYFDMFNEYPIDDSNIQANLAQFMNEIFILANKEKVKKQKLYSIICSYGFGCLAVYANRLIANGLLNKAMKYWELIHDYVIKWEKEYDLPVHKGSLFGFIAFVYIQNYDIETGFSYLHKAVVDDEKISVDFPEYHKKSPGYKIITLNSDTAHFMKNHIEYVRNGIKKDIEKFNSLFKSHSDFDIEQLDEFFLSNAELDKNDFYSNLKFYVAYYI